MKRQAGARWIPALGLIALMAWPGVHAEDGVEPQQLLIGQSITLQGGKNLYGTAVLDGVETYLSQAGLTLVDLAIVTRQGQFRH